jgi:glycosyltransferase involved in cell wall biosynthesis
MGTDAQIAGVQRRNPFDVKAPIDAASCASLDPSPSGVGRHKKLSILHVYAPTDAGGLDRVVEALAAGHHSMGHDVAVAAVSYGRSHDSFPALAQLRAHGVRVHEVLAGRRNYIGEARALYRLFCGSRPSVVHTHGCRTDVVAGAAARYAGLPTITTLHGRTGGTFTWRLFEWLQYTLARFFDAVVAVSEPQVELLRRRGVPAARLKLVPNAWIPHARSIERQEARRILGIITDLPVIGWTGRLSWEKGADVFIEALSRLERETFQAVIIGAGSAERSLRARAHELGLDERIRWLGLMPNAATYFSAFDLFVLSSRTEGTPIVLFEAMAADVPIVATRVGGVPAVLSDNEAVLVNSEDPNQLAAAIRTSLVNLATARSRAILAKRRLLASYRGEPWLARYLTLYATAVEQKP